MKRTESGQWKAYFQKKILDRGREYYRTGAVDKLVYDEDKTA